MKKETFPPWLVVALTVLAGSLFIGIAVFALRDSPELLQAGLFDDEADPGPIIELVNNVETVTTLPHGNLIDLFVTIIEILLALFSVFLTFAAIWSGILFFGSFGNEERIGQAKKILIWSVVGVMVTGVSYAFIYGIVNLDWSRG